MGRHKTKDYTIRREILFTQEEWELIHMRYECETDGQDVTFSRWARRVLSEPFNLSVTQTVDTSLVDRQITGVATNVNQIARLANTLHQADAAILSDINASLTRLNQALSQLHQDSQDLIAAQLTGAYQGRR